ncbi:hypothetical protein LMIY3S_04403 [Labrys miyagiensis]
MPPHRLGLILVTASAIAWSMAGFFTRLIALDTWTMLAWRGIFGALGIGTLILAIEGRRAWRGLAAMGWPGWTFALVSALGMVLFITALRHTTVAHVAVIYATVPFVAAALAWFTLRERPTGSAILASLAALAGVCVMVGLGIEGSPFGDVLALLMTVTMAVMMVIARKYRDIPVMHAAWLSAVLSAAASWPLGDPLALTFHDLWLLALFGLVNSALGLALFTLGARYLPAIETALIGSLDAPLAPLWVWLFFTETPGLGTLIGGLIVFTAVLLHILLSATLRRAARTAEP